MSSARLEKVQPLYPNTEAIMNFFGVLSAPVTVDWEITMRCNLQCLHCCFAAGAPRANELTAEEAKKLIGEMASIGVFRVGFTGGEPLARPDFLEIAEYAYDAGLELALNTNGTLITRSIATRIKRLFIEVQVSLDGAIPETHDHIRSLPGAFNRAIQGIRELQEAGTIVVVNTTLMSYNRHEILDILALAIELGVDVYRIIPVRALGRAHQNQVQPKIDDVVAVYRALEAVKGKVQDRIKIELTTVPSLLSSCADEGFACPAAVAKCCVDPEGNVKPCDAFDIFYGGNVRQEPLQKIWLESAQFQLFRQSLYRISPRECQICTYGQRCRGGCKGLAFITYGSLDKPDPFCVEIKELLRR